VSEFPIKPSQTGVWKWDEDAIERPVAGPPGKLQAIPPDGGELEHFKNFFRSG
jgi:hypothetical protein